MTCRGHEVAGNGRKGGSRSEPTVYTASNTKSNSNDSSSEVEPLSMSPSASQNPSLEIVCKDFHGRVTAFLNRKPSTHTANSDVKWDTKREANLVCQVQERTRTSLAVIEKALQEYEYVASSGPR